MTIAKNLTRRTARLVLGLAGAGLLAAGCASTPTPVSVADTAARAPNLTTLNRLIAQADLADALRGPGPFTVFAPSDDAFKAVPAATLEALGRDKALLKSVLTYHVLPVAVKSDEVKTGSAKTLQGANVALSRAGTFVTVEDAMVVQADVMASNGTVHVIDRVLMPPKK